VANPLIDPRQIRPSRGWYALAVLLPVLGVIAGIVVFALGVNSAVKTTPKLILRSDSGASNSVQLVGGRSYRIYVPVAAITSSSCELDNTATATVTPAIDDAAAHRLERFTSGGVTWQPRYEVDVTKTATYKISCGGTKFAVDDEDKTVSAQGEKLVGGLGIAAGVPCVALTIGVLIGIIVAVRRSSNRKRRLVYYSSAR
jgi:hypothetical protein